MELVRARSGSWVVVAMLIGGGCASPSTSSSQDNLVVGIGGSGYGGSGYDAPPPPDDAMTWPDAWPDAGVIDASFLDAMPDAYVDAMPDAYVDAMPDANVDAEVDAMPDAEVDAMPDAYVDASPDAPWIWPDAMPDAQPPPDGEPPPQCLYQDVYDQYADCDFYGNCSGKWNCFITWGPGPDDNATINEPCETTPGWREDQCKVIQSAHTPYNGPSCTGDNSDGACGLDSPGKQPATDEDMPPANTIAIVQWLKGEEIDGPNGYYESQYYMDGMFSDEEFGCPPNMECEYDVGGPGYTEPGSGYGGGGGGPMPGFAACAPMGMEGTPCNLTTGSTTAGPFTGACDFDGTCSYYYDEPAEPQLPDPKTDQKYKDAVAQNQFKGNKESSRSVVIFGDSVNAKHNQVKAGKFCVAPKTTADKRGLVGNDYPESPMGKTPAFDHTRALACARTGWSSDAAMSRNPGDDACKNPGTWPAAGTWSPQEVGQVWAKQEPQKAKRIVVADGGINDKDWTSSLSHLAACNLLASVVEEYNKPGRYSTGIARFVVTVNGNNAESKLLEVGGTCTVVVTRKWRLWPVGPIGTLMSYAKITVPAFSYTPAQLAAITAHVQALRAAVTPWAGRLLWLRYYDINPAEIDVRSGLPELVAAYTADWNWIKSAAGYIPGTFIANIVQTIPKAQRTYITTLKNQLNGAIWAGLGNCGVWNAAAQTRATPTDCSAAQDKSVLFTGVPAGWGAASMQRTVIGGMPHPSSAAGSALLGNTLKDAVDF
ncbi:MAG TPA: hypothetical protein VL463_21565 [Kofleriaceae bacterium]|nr:hypothetical protein [Kofleriaceae bacterium]